MEEDWGHYSIQTPDQSPQIKALTGPDVTLQPLSTSNSRPSTEGVPKIRQDDFMNFLLSDKFNPCNTEPSYVAKNSENATNDLSSSKILLHPVPQMQRMNLPQFSVSEFDPNSGPLLPNQISSIHTPTNPTLSLGQNAEVLTGAVGSPHQLSLNAPSGVFFPPQNAPIFPGAYQKPKHRQSLPGHLPSKFSPVNFGGGQNSSVESSPGYINRVHGSFPNLSTLAITGSPEQRAQKLGSSSNESWKYPEKALLPQKSDEVQIETSKPAKKKSTSLSNGKQLDDKKAKRLAKNRESARASRRKNKEYLERLEKSNSNMLKQITDVKWSYLEACILNLRRIRKEEIEFLQNRWREKKAGNSVLNAFNDQMYSELTTSIHQKYGQCCDEQRAMMQYEHSEMVNKICPSYQRFLLWLTGQSDQFFERIDGSTSDIYKWTTSNKFIGDKLFSQGKITANTDHGGGMWQLLCHEIGISLEQEEKLTSIRTRVRSDENNYRERGRIAENQILSSQLGHVMMLNAAEIQSRIDHFQSILSPAQMFECLEWMEQNKNILEQLKNDDFLPCVDELVKEDAGNFAQLMEKPENELTFADVKTLCANIPGFWGGN